MNNESFRVFADINLPHRFRAGFQIGFTDCVVSVIWGNGMYCDSRFAPIENHYDVESGITWGNTAEVAVKTHNDSFLSGWPHSNPHDDVSGWLTPDQVAEVIAWAKDYRNP